MAKTIWKYKLEINEVQYIEMPEGSEVLTVQLQGGDVCMWALVDPDSPMTHRRFHVFGTGHPIDVKVELGYIGTFQIGNLGLVFHVFEPKQPLHV